MEPLYKPEGVEARWQQTWEAEGLYNAEVDPAREPYTIAFPPPNVTGELHMGHALNASIQDTLIRLHRMRGFNALWQPGTTTRASPRRTSSSESSRRKARPATTSGARRSSSSCGRGSRSTAA